METNVKPLGSTWAGLEKSNIVPEMATIDRTWIHAMVPSLSLKAV